MKRRILLCLIAAFVVAGFLILLRRAPSDALPDQEIARDDARDGFSGTGTSNAVQTDLSDLPGDVGDRGDLSAERLMQEMHSASIQFYGKVIDEQGLPVAGATATLEWANAAGEGITSKQVTDSHGRFSLPDARGSSLQVRVHKDGYYNVKRSNEISFAYSSLLGRRVHKADPADPVFFHLRRRGQGVPLISSRRGGRDALRIVPVSNAAPVGVDLMLGRTNDSGPLFVHAMKTPKDFSTGQSDWQLGLTIPNGGFLAHDDEFPFEAPESGYIPKVNWGFTNGSPGWIGDLREHFYIRFGDPPLYGTLTVEASAFTSGIRLEYKINPTGGRYLEPQSSD